MAKKTDEPVAEESKISAVDPQKKYLMSPRKKVFL